MSGVMPAEEHEDRPSAGGRVVPGRKGREEAEV